MSLFSWCFAVFLGLALSTWIFCGIKLVYYALQSGLSHGESMQQRMMMLAFLLAGACAAICFQSVWSNRFDLSDSAVPVICISIPSILGVALLLHLRKTERNVRCAFRRWRRRRHARMPA